MKLLKNLLCLCVLCTLITVSCTKDEEQKPLQISLNVQNLTTPLTPNGSVDLQIIGGVEPYSILWSNNEVTEDIQNLTAGSYSVTVTDAANNSISDSSFIEGPLTVVYFGQSYFEIISPKGIRIITDPSTTHMPGAAPRGSADIVMATHNHADHTAYSLISDYSLKITPGSTEVVSLGDVKIEGYNSLHGELDGQAMGANTIYIITVGNSKIAHLGENRAITESEIITALQDVDVLLAPVGEIASMSIPEVFDLAKKVNAKIIIPHHYCYSATDDFYGSTTIDDFMERIADGFTIEESELYIINDNPIEKTVVHLIPMFELL